MDVPYWSSCAGKLAWRGEPVLDRLATHYGKMLLGDIHQERGRKPSDAVAEILWGNTQELAEYAAKVALIGEATFGRNQFQGKAAVVQQGLCPVYAPRQNISVRCDSEISLKFAREVVAA